MIPANQRTIVEAVNARSGDIHARRLMAGIQAMKSRLKEELEGNAEYQRRCRMTAEEKQRGAIEMVAKNRMEREGIGFEEAREQVVKLVTPAFYRQGSK